MFLEIRQIWCSLSRREQILSILVLFLLWGGVAAAVLLSQGGIIDDPGTFFWGCILGSFVDAYLAYGKKKRDIVSMLTPVYAIIIFMGLELAPTLFLQVLYAGSLTVLLYRLHMNFSE
jgi:uncharacterized membrane protein YjjP (DUF1212 family)